MFTFHVIITQTKRKDLVLSSTWNMSITIFKLVSLTLLGVHKKRVKN